MLREHAAHHVQRLRRIHDSKALRLAARTIEISVANALEEAHVLALELVPAAAFILLALQAFARNDRRHVEQDREVGLAIAVNPRLECGDALERNAMPPALVREGRVGEPITQDPFATRERRPDHLLEMLASR